MRKMNVRGGTITEGTINGGMEEADKVNEGTKYGNGQWVSSAMSYESRSNDDRVGDRG